MKHIAKCDPRAKARCPYKNLCCGNEQGYFMEGSHCDKFNQSVTAPPPTNADRIRAMSNEELADWLISEAPKIVSTHIWCKSGCEESCTHELDCVKNWLTQPTEED